MEWIKTMGLPVPVHIITRAGDVASPAYLFLVIYLCHQEGGKRCLSPPNPRPRHSVMRLTGTFILGSQQLLQAEKACQASTLHAGIWSPCFVEQKSEFTFQERVTTWGKQHGIPCCVDRVFPREIRVPIAITVSSPWHNFTVSKFSHIHDFICNFQQLQEAVMTRMRVQFYK